jgi:hypothetical protein
VNFLYHVEIRDPLPDGSRPRTGEWRRILDNYAVPLDPGAALPARIRAAAVRLSQTLPAISTPPRLGGWLRKGDIRRMIDHYRTECIATERNPDRKRAKQAAETAIDAVQSLMLCYELRGYDARLVFYEEVTL